VAINCSAIPENLIESELFGHEKGAFTGADKQRKGLIEGAADGTLFLDEIGDLPASVQVKLLRFLQDKRLQRVGAREDFQIDTRIVAATNADLKQNITEGRFREDLFFRLAVVVLNLPPLRKRGIDVTTLAQEFLIRFAAENGRKDLVFAPTTLNAITQHPWPGNVRELQNRVQRAVIMADGKKIQVGDMELSEASSFPSTLKEARELMERDMLERALKTHGGKVAAAAKELGISRPTFYELMEKLGIAREG
jgi:two-component system NtrC family response regulator